MADSIHLRSWWFHKQGLDGSLQGSSAASILEKTGWARSIGGANPYLQLFARGGLSKEQIENSQAKLEIHELPSARGCTYIVPKEHFALALKVGEGFSNEFKIAEKFLGVTSKEIQTLMDRVLKALAKGARDPRQLKDDLGDAVRNLGEAGKKRGMTTTLPMALGKLQEEGKIRRVPLNGRLDQQRYSYVVWSPSPLAKYKKDSADSLTELAQNYFRWIGPASVKEFQWFSGLGVSVLNEALKPLKLVSIEEESDLLILPDELKAFRSFKPSSKPSYALISSLDSLFLLRRNLSHFIDEKDGKRKVFVEKSKEVLSGLQDLPNNAIVDRGRIIGLWEFEPSSGKIISDLFAPSDQQLKKKIRATERFIREELGDARSFSLDSPESRAPRIAALRK
ncbi:MAG TPA: crosslink repair DNA glycosylase YcaQ family protein [Acidobacteriota bacterium]|nr:crosslink repair DNA glycosylase YcaQ family protein [Acidobacteriota bacterium]